MNIQHITKTALCMTVFLNFSYTHTSEPLRSSSTITSHSFWYGVLHGVTTETAKRVLFAGGAQLYNNTPTLEFSCKYETNPSYRHGMHGIAFLAGAASRYGTESVAGIYGPRIWQKFDKDTQPHTFRTGYTWASTGVAFIAAIIAQFTSDHQSRQLATSFEAGSLLLPSITLVSYEDGHWYICGYPLT